MFNKKVKKLVLGSLMVVMAASLVGGCGSSSTTTSNNKLIVGTNATFVPFEFKDDKTQDYAGFDIDLIRAIGKRINKDVELKNVAFDALIPALNTHDIDVAASGMTITKARSEKVLFSSPYYENALAIGASYEAASFANYGVVLMIENSQIVKAQLNMFDRNTCIVYLR